MNKVYIIIPLIGLALFSVFYIKFTKEHDVKLAAIVAKEEEAKKEKARQEVINREKAIQAAIEAQAKRKAEREAKEKLDEEKRVARQVAEEKRERSFSDRNKFADQSRRLKKDLEEVQEEVKKIELQKKTLLDEQDFLKKYVRQAEANVKYYQDLLEKIAQADKARAEAAAAAAAAAKKS